MSSRICVLFEGYSQRDPDDRNHFRSNCSCVLIKTSSGRNFIVDTMTAWDGERILKGLHLQNIKPEDIYAVICTHGHSDHIGCNYLFPTAEFHFVGHCISHRDKYYDWNKLPGGNDDIFKLDSGNVVIERTPGHTMSCISVIVRNTQLGEMVGICGDLFECVEDINDESIWIDAGSEDPIMQRHQRLRIAQKCDYIIPGHGPGFSMTEYMRKKLYSASGLD